MCPPHLSQLTFPLPVTRAWRQRFIFSPPHRGPFPRTCVLDPLEVLQLRRSLPWTLAVPSEGDSAPSRVSSSRSWL